MGARGDVEAESGSGSEAGSGGEGEAGSGSEAGSESEAGSGSESEAGAEAESEGGSGSGAEAESEGGSESESESEVEPAVRRPPSAVRHPSSVHRPPSAAGCPPSAARRPPSAAPEPPTEGETGGWAHTGGGVGSSTPPSLGPLLARAAVGSAALAVPAAGVALAAAGPHLALGIALGALVGWLNLIVLGRQLARLVAAPHRSRPRAPNTPVFPKILLWKWPALLLALGGLLWYMPARPEGVAVGILLSLAATAWAARPHPGTSTSPSSPPSPRA